MQGGELGWECLDVASVAAGEVVAREAGEEFERAGCGRLGAAALFGVERQFADLLLAHRAAEVAFDQAAAQQRDVLAEEQRFDPFGALDQHGGGVLNGLELVVALFEVGLVAVGDQELGGGELVVVADQWEAAVA